MSEASFTRLNEEYAVAAQIALEDLQAISQAGFRTLLINRPDGEGGPAQPTSEQMIKAAEELGLKAVYLPIISGGPTEADIEEFAVVIEDLPKPVFAYCRSGNRSATVYALAAAKES
ncbi:MAG: TIGR01244 family phosphatase [Alcaligenaceae bacterium]|jgi:sulfide:quinone oxidoreductase|nr:TIGR01244 family phosphatase [Alcaligenaceae bacterium]